MEVAAGQVNFKDSLPPSENNCLQPMLHPERVGNSRVQHRFQNISCRAGKLHLKFTCPVGTSTCHATLLNIGELHCEDCAQNTTCQAGQVRVLPDCRFLLNSLAMGQVVMLHADNSVSSSPLIHICLDS